MPSYDYRCPENNQIVEVKHSITETLKTWGEVCERAGIGLDDTSADAPVERLITGGGFVKSSSMGSAPPCESRAPCCGGVCGFK